MNRRDCIKSRMASTCLRTQQIFVTLTVEEGQTLEVGLNYLSLDLNWASNQSNFEKLLCTLQSIKTTKQKNNLHIFCLLVFLSV